MTRFSFLVSSSCFLLLPCPTSSFPWLTQGDRKIGEQRSFYQICSIVVWFGALWVCGSCSDANPPTPTHTHSVDVQCSLLRLAIFCPGLCFLQLEPMTPSWFQSAHHIYPLWGYLTPWDGLWAESCSRLCFLLGSSQLTRGETCVSFSLEVQLVCILPPPVRSEVKFLSCVRLCNPMDCSLPGSSIHGIFQARVLEWVAISFSRGSSLPRDRTQVSHIEGRHFTH